MTLCRPKYVAVYSLWANNLAAAVSFYRDVLGFRLLPHHAHLPAFDLGGGSHLVIIEGQPIPARDSNPPHFPLIAFVVDDLDISVERLRVHGVEMPWGVERDEGSCWVKFRDPSANLIEFVQFIGPNQH
jgi:catechol 2,3-dioxygenase-like lactoylglutathione lyase family enzyme